MSYQNAEMDKLIDAARFETDPDEVPERSSRASSTCPSTEVPRIPLFQPYLDVAMQKSIVGYQYWFHRQLDFRQISKG